MKIEGISPLRSLVNFVVLTTLASSSFAPLALAQSRRGASRTEVFDVTQCRANMTRKVGQSIIAFVTRDAANDSGVYRPQAIDPAYIRMVVNLKLLGIRLPSRFQGRDATGYSMENYVNGQLSAISAINTALETSHLPPILVTHDLSIDAFNSQMSLGGATQRHFGPLFGYGIQGQPFVARTSTGGNQSVPLDALMNNGQPGLCLRAVSKLNAYLTRAIGTNVSFGPAFELTYGSLGRGRSGFRSQWSTEDRDTVVPAVIEQLVRDMRQAGIYETLKHYPYVPTGNQHTVNTDLSLSQNDFNTGVGFFETISNRVSRAVGASSFALMSHTYDDQVDPNYIATASSIWYGRLRRLLPNAFLIADASVMATQWLLYPSSRHQMSVPFGTNIRDGSSLTAAQSLLAGANAVILAGNAGSTQRTFDDLIDLSCQDNTNARLLRQRVEANYQKAIAFKTDHAAALRPSRLNADSVTRAQSLMRQTLNYMVHPTGSPESAAICAEAMDFAEQLRNTSS